MVSLSDLENLPKVFETIFGGLGRRLWRPFGIIAVIAILLLSLAEIGGVITKAVHWLMPQPKSPAVVPPPVSAPLAPALVPGAIPAPETTAPPPPPPTVQGPEAEQGRSQPIPDQQPQASLAEKSTTAAPDRIFINVSAEYLISLYKDRTAYRAQALTQVYLGKWMRVSGPLGTISGPAEYGNIFVSFELPDYRSIDMTFDRHWADRFAVLTPDQTITAVCQLSRVGPVSVNLDKCELTAE
jgi:hypothetical protein